MNCVQNIESQHKRTPRQAALHSLLTLQQRIKSPFQERLFLRCDWIAAKLNMSPTDRATFQWLAHCGYSNAAGLTFVTQIRLSTLIGISTKSISRTIDKLERLGIVKRQQQAIRKRAGRTLYGAMQNEFTEAFRTLIQCPDLRAIAVVDRPCQIQDFVVEGVESENKITMPPSQQQLQWLANLLGNKYLVFKLMALAKPHMRARGLTDLNDLLRTYREPLESGYFKNPGAFLITSMMRKTFKDFDQTFESDSRLEDAKRQIRQQQAAQKISQQFTEQGHQIIADLEEGIEHHFFDPSTLQSYKLQQGRVVACAYGGTTWSVCSLDKLAWKIGSGQIKAKRRNNTEPGHSQPASVGQILQNMSATLKRTKSLKTETGQTESASPADQETSMESARPSCHTTPQHNISSLHAIAEMRKILHSSRRIHKLTI